MYKKFTQTLLVQSSLIVLLFSLLVTSCATGATEFSPKLTEVTSADPPAPTDTLAPVSDEPAGEIVSGGGDVLLSPAQRELNPDVSDAEMQALAAGNTDFALALYQVLKKNNGNLFYSPYSISSALAMTYAGARSDTETQMAEVMRFTLAQDRLHSAYNVLDLTLESRAEHPSLEDTDGFRLNIANALWGQVNYPFHQEYIDLLAQNYGAGLRLKDFGGDAEGSRVDINDWVSEQTENRIQDLIPAGEISNLTRLVLTNAVYFNASWLFQFEEMLTEETSFQLLNGSQVMVPMMSLADPKTFMYGTGTDYQVVELPYFGSQQGMTIILPNEGSFEGVEARLNGTELNDIFAAMSPIMMTLHMPKFEYEAEISLAETLATLGMPDAFAAGAADFSGMDGTRELFVSDVFHKAFVSVDEEGTEAAAATAVVIGVTSLPMSELELTIDRPFIYMIRDIETNSILFVGRVLNPAGSE